MASEILAKERETMNRRMLFLSQVRLLSHSSFKSKAPLTYLLKTQSETHGRSNFQVTKPLQDHVRVPPNRKGFSGFRAFCTAKDLSAKKCVPCSSKDVRPMTEEAAAKLISEVPEWNLVNEEGTWKLNRSWKAKSFTKGLELFKLVADIAEAEGHHPDLHLIGWNNVKIEIWTHSVGGLTENDFILAAKINTLDLQHLLRRKAANN